MVFVQASRVGRHASKLSLSRRLTISGRPDGDAEHFLLSLLRLPLNYKPRLDDRAENFQLVVSEPLGLPQFLSHHETRRPREVHGALVYGQLRHAAVLRHRLLRKFRQRRVRKPTLSRLVMDGFVEHHRGVPLRTFSFPRKSLIA